MSKEINKLNNDILELVNASIQPHCSKKESDRLLKNAQEVARYRNHKKDTSFQIMENNF